MIRGNIVRILGYYRDPSLIERIVAAFRKLWVDIYWMNVRKLDENNSLYEAYLLAADVPNFKLAILNLSKTVEIEKVEILQGARLEEFTFDGERFVKEKKEGNNNYVFYVPVNVNKIVKYSWGEKLEQDIQR